MASSSSSTASGSSRRSSRRSETPPAERPLPVIIDSPSPDASLSPPTPGSSKTSEGEEGLLSEAFTHKVSLEGAPPTSPALPAAASHKRELSASALAGAAGGGAGGAGGIGLERQALQDGGELSRFNSLEIMQRVPPPPGKKSNNGTTPSGIRELKNLSEAPPSMYRFGSASFASPLAVGRADSGPFLPPRSKTLVIFPPACLRHETMNHQEHKDRLSMLCGPRGVLRRPAFAALEWADGDSVLPACLADLLRVHDLEYLRHLQKLCLALPSDANSSLLEGLPAALQGKAPPHGSGPPPELKREASSDDGGGSGMEVGREGSGGDLAYAPPATARVMPTLAHNTSIRSFPVHGQGLEGEEASDADSVYYAGSGPHRPFPARGTLAAAATGTDTTQQGVSQFLDTDTRISRGSWEAARVASGAVVQAVDMLASGRYSRCFVAARPPGHHAGPRGAVPSHCFWKAPGMCSSGFCLINHLAIGAAYARHTYGRPPSGRFQRVAIIDFDIHHGNGTEEIIRGLKPCQRLLPLPASWAPQTYENYRPWLSEDDADFVFFGSINLTDGLHFYPCSGREAENDFERHPHIVNVELTPVRGPTASASAAVVGKPRTAVSHSEKKMKENIAKASAEFRSKVGNELLPKLGDFAPDLIFISAGFDGHYLDLYHYLDDEDYAWLTRELVAIADANKGGVISVLEGGYHIKRDPKVVKPRGPSARTAKGRNNTTTSAAEASSSSATSVEGSVAGGGMPPSDDDEGAGDGGGGGGSVTLEETDGGLQRGVVAHVLELLQ